MQPNWRDWPGWTQDQSQMKDHLCLMAYAGSHAHNTVTPETDDIDLMGVSIFPPAHYFGLSYPEEFRYMSEWKEWTYDVVVYDIRKFVRLLLKQNPNVLCLLALKDHSYLLKSPAGQALIEHKHLFFSKKMYQSFTGYAYAQLQLLKRGISAPTGRMGEKRKQLIEQHGVDTKAAAHLIRLLRMGTEFLSTGELNVWREDSPELLAIKNGQWSIERVEEEATRLFRLAEEALVTSQLPNAPNYQQANDLVVQLITQHERTA